MNVKRNLIICLLFVFSFVLFHKDENVKAYDVFDPCSSFDISEDNTRTTYLDNYFSTIYFDNLNYNLGENVKGSCGYVAIGMYLSYLDTYWDDDIISEYNDYVTILNTNQMQTRISWYL